MKAKILNREEFIKLFPTTDNSVLAKKYGVSESAIRTTAAKLKLNKAYWLWVRHDENFVLLHYKKGKYTINDIAVKIGRTRWAVINKFRELTNKRK